MPAFRHAKSNGFSLIELMLAVFIIACFLIFFSRTFVIGSHRAETAQLSVPINYRVFEADADLVDRLIPANDRWKGVQPNVKHPGHMIFNSSYINSQFAPVIPATVNALLQGMAAKPGLLASGMWQVTSDWWYPGLAGCWCYSRADNTFLGGGGGNIFLGARKINDVVQVRMEGMLNHAVDLMGQGPHPDVNSHILYEGPMPRIREFVFLVPFARDDGSPHYLVTVFDFNGQTNRSLALQSDHDGLFTH